MSGAEQGDMEIPLPEPEFSRMVAAKPLPATALKLEATEYERAALASRFALIAIDSLHASLTLRPDTPATIAHGTMTAKLRRPCAVSGEEFTEEISVPIELRFVPDADYVGGEGEQEIELDAEDCDDIPYSGEHFDVGEAVAQSLGLAIDPYAAGPQAERVRREMGLDAPAADSPFAALAALQSAKSEES